jgi:hypothetical protein
MCFLWGMKWIFISGKTAFFIVTAVKTSNLSCRIWGCQSGSYKYWHLMVYSAAKNVYEPTFWRTISPSSTGWTLVTCSADFRPRRWSLYDPPKHQFTYQLHLSITQNMRTFAAEYVRNYQIFTVLYLWVRPYLIWMVANKPPSYHTVMRAEVYRFPYSERKLKVIYETSYIYFKCCRTK